MSYGGLINTVLDPFGVGDPDAPGTPNPKKVGRQYLDLIRAYAKGAPTIYGTESEFKPQYTQLGLQNANLSLFGNEQAPGLLGLSGAANTYGRASGVNDLANFGPSAIAAVSAMNPQYAGLNQAATQGLQLGNTIDPNQIARIRRDTYGDYGSRGFGPGTSAVNTEAALRYYGAGNAAQQQRQQFATQVGGLNQISANNALGVVSQPNEAFNTALGYGAASGPTIIPGSQSYDAFNTAYNASAASKIAAANNAAAGSSY